MPDVLDAFIYQLYIYHILLDYNTVYRSKKSVAMGISPALLRYNSFILFILNIHIATESSILREFTLNNEQFLTHPTRTTTIKTAE